MQYLKNKQSKKRPWLKYKSCQEMHLVKNLIWCLKLIIGVNILNVKLTFQSISSQGSGTFSLI